MYFKSGWDKELWLWCLTPLDVNNISVILRVIWNDNTRKILLSDLFQKRIARTRLDIYFFIVGFNE
jgi:hypothetical protein